MSSDVHQLNTRYQFDDFMKLTCSVCFLIGKAPFCGLLLECPWSPQKVECCPGNRAQFASRCYIFDKFNSSVISRRSNRCLTVIQLLFWQELHQIWESKADHCTNTARARLSMVWQTHFDLVNNKGTCCRESKCYGLCDCFEAFRGVSLMICLPNPFTNSRLAGLGWSPIAIYAQESLTNLAVDFAQGAEDFCLSHLFRLTTSERHELLHLQYCSTITFSSDSTKCYRKELAHQATNQCRSDWPGSFGQILKMCFVAVSIVLNVRCFLY